MRIRRPNGKAIPENLPCDYRVLSGLALWNASKNRLYRESIHQKLEGLHRFLRHNQMYDKNEIAFTTAEDFEIRRDLLTEAGFEFVWKYLQGYLEHLEKTLRTYDPDYLEACLKYHQSNSSDGV